LLLLIQQRLTVAPPDPKEVSSNDWIENYIPVVDNYSTGEV